MKTVDIYTDGACKGNPGPGGWAAILICEGKIKYLSGGEAATTNNRMELLGAISGFEALKVPCEVTLHSDSSYVINGLSKGWAKAWKKNGWVKSDKKPALNPELWERLLNAIEPHYVKYEWVKGHAGNMYNEQCDALAVTEAEKFLKA